MEAGTNGTSCNILGSSGKMSKAKKEWRTRF